MEKYQLLFESVFKKDPAGPDVPGFLEKIAEEYPYFSTAQFYLLRSLKKDSATYKQQVKKTTVIFNNNYWLNFQLLEAGKSHTSIVDQQKFSLEEETDISSPNTDLPSEESFTATGVVTEATVIEPVETLQQVPEEIIPASDITAEMEVENPATDQPYAGELIVPEESRPEIIIKNPEPEQTEQTEILADDQWKEAENIVAEETEPVITVEENELPPLKLSLDPVPTDKAENEMLFEPLHTTDYFASVGIKLSEEAKSTDKLGKQLKSFTEWLKTMKKVHAEQLTRTSTPAEIEANSTESNIQQLAERSNVEDEVLTEAMADVLLQQGRTNKALEVLEKLSLLNPAKSAYFAAKINQIKEP